MTIKNHLVKRIILTLITAIGVTIIAFLILHLTPGDPARIMLGSYASEENLEAVRAKYNLDEPLHIQYIVWMENLVKGDLGTSIRYNRSVNNLLGDRIAKTLLLTVTGLVFSIVFGVIFGILAAPFNPYRGLFTSHATFMSTFLILGSVFAISIFLILLRFLPPNSISLLSLSKNFTPNACANPTPASFVALPPIPIIISSMS